MNKIYNIAIIGAGASGLMLASLLNKNKNVIIIDNNNQIGKKLKVCGGGKCNITNTSLSKSNYHGDISVLDQIFNHFDNNKLINFFQNQGIKLSIQNRVVNGQYFAKSSQYIIDLFQKSIQHHHLKLNTKVINIEFNNYYTIFTTNSIIKAKKIVIASGGLSFSSLGASSIGYDIAKKFGHTIDKTSPALVGYTVQKNEFWFKKLSGVSLKISLKINNKTIIGNILFTHKGCSGPAILNSSIYWNKGSLEIDFLPNQKIQKYLNSKALISTILPLPKRFLKEFLNHINIKDKPINKLTKDELNLLNNQLKHYKFAPAGTFGYTKSEVTKGGIIIDEIDINSMQSKLQKNLYFIGEILNITGELGGYNLQWAFSSAYICANKI